MRSTPSKPTRKPAASSGEALQWAAKPLVPQAWKPHNYQRKGVRFLLEHGAAALLLDPSLGKTSIVLAAMRVLLKQGLSRGALIVAPLRPCYKVWPEEVLKWKDFNHLSVGILHGDRKDKVLQEDHDLYVINPEGLQWLLGNKANAKRLFEVVDTLVIDELSKFKKSGTKRFKLLKPWLGKFLRRWGLTGSPAANGLLGLFGQAYVLDLGRALGQYITHYRMQYFSPSGFGGYDWKPQNGAEERIYERLRPLALRMAAEDYLKLPEVVAHTVWVDMPRKVRQFYDELEEEMLAEIQGKTITAVTAATVSGKCSQVANGGIYGNVDPLAPKQSKHDRIIQLHDAKTDALEELVDELEGKPTLVAYEYEHDLERILKRFPKVPYLGKGVSMKATDRTINDWNAGRIPVLPVQPQSVAHGLNMQEASNYIIWYSLIWDYELYDQLIRRLRRQGAKYSKVFNFHIAMLNSIDIVKLRAMESKATTQNALFAALRSYGKHRSLAA